jgi:hypothetical protein
MIYEPCSSSVKIIKNKFIISNSLMEITKYGIGMKLKRKGKRGDEKR